MKQLMFHRPAYSKKTTQMSKNLMSWGNSLLISFQKCQHFASKCHGSDSIVNVMGCGVALVYLIVLTTLYSGGTQGQGLFSECLCKVTGRMSHSSYQTHNGDLTIIIAPDVISIFTVMFYPLLKGWSCTSTIGSRCNEKYRHGLWLTHNDTSTRANSLTDYLSLTLFFPSLGFHPKTHEEKGLQHNHPQADWLGI